EPPPPKESARGIAAPRANRRKERQKCARADSRALRGAAQEQLLQDLPELRPMRRISKRELHEGFEIAWEVSNVVAFFVRGELYRHHPLALLAKKPDGVGYLNLATLIGGDAADHIKDQRRENVAAGDRQIARSFVRVRLLDQVDHAKR